MEDYDRGVKIDVLERYIDLYNDLFGMEDATTFSSVMSQFAVDDEALKRYNKKRFKDCILGGLREATDYERGDLTTGITFKVRFVS